jgi:hypothetical protein
MGVQKVMSRSGHDEYAFDKADKVSTEEAARRFEALSKTGVWIDTEKGVVMKRFDPNVESMRYQPQLVGG